MDYETKGASLLQTIWFGMVKRIVDAVIKEVGADEEQAAVIREIYLIPGNYQIRLTS